MFEKIRHFFSAIKNIVKLVEDQSMYNALLIQRLEKREQEIKDLKKKVSFLANVKSNKNSVKKLKENIEDIKIDINHIIYDDRVGINSIGHQISFIKNQSFDKVGAIENNLQSLLVSLSAHNDRILKIEELGKQCLK